MPFGDVTAARIIYLRLSLLIAMIPPAVSGRDHSHIMARQLRYNRREICPAAMRSKRFRHERNRLPGAMAIQAVAV